MRLHNAFFPLDAAGDVTDGLGYFMRALTGVVLPNPSSAPSVDGPAETPSTDSEPSPQGSTRTKRAKP